MNRWMLSVAALGVSTVGLLAFMAPSFAQDKSGVAAAVNPNAQSTPPGQAARTLLVGADVIFQERIATQADGQVQLIFLDESSLTVGPGSDVVIDEFVYDPKTRSGKMAVRMTGGLVRFVGGRISKNGDVSITTPVNVIGIRGGMGYVEVSPTQVTATNLFGTVSVTGASGGEQIISRPGFAVTNLAGQAPLPPIKVDTAQLARLSKSMEASPQAAGRNASGAIEGKLDSSQVSEKNSNQTPDSISPSATSERAMAARNPASLDSGLVRQAVQQTVTSQIQNSLSDSTGLITGEVLGQFNRVLAFFKNGRIDPTTNTLRFTFADGTSTLPLPPRGSAQIFNQGPVSTASYQAPDGKYFFFNTTVPISNGFGQVTFAGGQAVRPVGYKLSGAGYRVFDFVSDNSNIMKFVGNNVAAYTNKVETPLLWRTASGGSLGDQTQERTVSLYASLAIDGQGASQRSGIVVATGVMFQETSSGNARPAASGTVRGTFNDGGQFPITKRLTGGYGSVGDETGNSFYGATRPDYYTISNNNYDSRGRATNDITSFNVAGANGSVSSNVQYVYAIAPSTKPVDVPLADAPRSTRTMNGYIGGGVGLSGSIGNGQYLQMTTQGADPGNVIVSTNGATNRVEAKFRVDTLPTAAGFSANGGASFNGNTPGRQVFSEYVRLDLNFGSLDGSHRGRSAFLNDAVYAATDQRLTADATSGSFYGNGVASASAPAPVMKPFGGPSVDPSNPAGNASDTLYMVSSSAVPLNGIVPAGVSLCECSFMSWGWWGGHGGIDDPANTSRGLRIHAANYVVGVLPPISQIPTAGTAVYNGHIVGTVRDGVTQYIAAGAFQKNWDFASRTGTMAVRNFDGGNYQATSTSSANPGTFAYNGTGTRGAIRVDGAFFAAPNDPVKGVGGQFLINSTGTAYRASGVIVGQR